MDHAYLTLIRKLGQTMGDANEGMVPALEAESSTAEDSAFAAPLMPQQL
jgi:hypothetical protein